MTRIGGGPPSSGKPPESVGRAAAEPKPGEAPKQQQTREATAETPKKLADSFERVGPQITRQLEAMAGKKATLGPVHFTSAHLAQVAQAFAILLRKNPGADRRKRASMFAKAILTSKGFGRIFDEADEAELEKLYDMIGDQLDTSPRLAQLVDDVTEGARKLTPG